VPHTEREDNDHQELTALEHSVQPAPGSIRIPGYDLLETIGEGGMGVVYRAVQHEPHRTVAIKFLAPVPSDRLAAEAFERESRLMASVKHPNVVAIHDSGQAGGRYYLVMEYVSGPPLRSLMKPGQAWPISKAVPLLDSIARALSHIHDQGILHLDLKPENVLCVPAGTIKITDFGLALRRVDAWTLSDLGLVQGTIDYCPPEQRYGLPIDQRSDLFSLATLAYELLTGTLPGRVYVSAVERNPVLPPALDGVLRRGLARDRDERYASVEEFRRELLAALEGTARQLAGPAAKGAGS
jgi:serine/threonine protein kinase